MKINEKNLISFAMSKTPVDRKGWMFKKGEVNKSLQKRWFILKGNMLFYFEKADDKEPIGVIILEGCTIELDENEHAYAFKLVFHGSGNRTYILCTNTQDDLEEWMKAIASASYDYMKLMVAELQRQLLEITELENENKLNMQKRIQSGRLPFNRSDSCLCSRGESSKASRTNPFEKSTIQNDVNGMGMPTDLETLRMTGALSEDDLSRHTIRNSKANRQKYLFLEMHRYYSQIFQTVYRDIKEKKKPDSTEKLINFD